MIETKEQYVDWFPIDTACRIDWDEPDINDVHETIEALRDFAKAYSDIGKATTAGGHIKRMRRAKELFDALPEWITEE